MIVVDTNVIAYLCLTSPKSGQAEKVRKTDPEWAAPILWRSEFRSVLSQYLKRKDLTLDEASRIAEECEEMMAGREYVVSSERVLGLAAASGCSAYDCEYVALAQDLGVKLVTADPGILSKFQQTAVSPEAFPPRSSA